MTTAQDVSVLAGKRRDATLARRALDFVEKEWLLLALCAFVVARTAFMDRLMLTSDSYYSFLYGREIIHHGLPHHDTMTVMGGGRAWIDQQWLGHLALYGLAALGGPKLAAIVSSLLFSFAYVGVVVLARRRGAGRLAVAALAFLAMYYSTTVVQTEVFSRVFFLATLVLLAAESHKPSRRVWLMFPLLVVWANVHGAVVLGATLVALLGVVEGFRWLRGVNPGRRALARAVGLVALPWACIVATPYGFAIASYYRTTMFSSAFHRYIDIWQRPSPFAREDGPFFTLLAIAAYLAFRYRRNLGLYEKTVLAVTLLAALEARRSIPWFIAACILFLPAARRQQAPARAGRSTALLRLAAATFGLLLATFAVGRSLVKPQSYFTSWFYDDAAAAYVAHYAREHPRAIVWANDPLGDWLVYGNAALWGRVAYDARWENLTPVQIEALHDFLGLVGPDWAKPIYRYDLVLMSRRASKKPLPRLRHDPRLRLAYQDRRIVIFERALDPGRGERR